MAMPAPGGTWWIARVLKVPRDDDEPLDLQWMSNRMDKQSAHSTYKPAWIREDGREYYNDRCNNDPPFTTLSSETEVTRKDIVLHDFQLTTGSRLNAPTYKALKRARLDWPEDEFSE